MSKKISKNVRAKFFAPFCGKLNYHFVILFPRAVLVADLGLQLLVVFKAAKTFLKMEKCYLTEKVVSILQWLFCRCSSIFNFP